MSQRSAAPDLSADAAVTIDGASPEPLAAASAPATGAEPLPTPVNPSKSENGSPEPGSVPAAKAKPAAIPQGKDAKPKGKEKAATKGKDGKGKEQKDDPMQQLAAEVEALKGAVAAKEGEVAALKEQLEQEKLERNKTELELEKVKEQLATSEASIAELRAAIVQKEAEALSTEERHTKDIQNLKGQNKQLVHSHQKLTADLIAQHMNQFQAAMAEHLGERQKLIDQQNQLRVEMNGRELKFVADLSEAAACSARDVSKATDQLEAEGFQLSSSFDQRMQQAREESERIRAAEAAKSEELRNSQASELKRLHERQVAELKRWFRDVVTSNASTIETLKSENDRLRTALDALGGKLKEMKGKLAAAEKDLERAKVVEGRVKSR